MASAKRKTTAKRTVRYAAKSQTGASQFSPSAGWMSQGAADWQKGASEWAKESAKLYQMPFAQGDMNAAAQQAASTMKSASENMAKAGSEMMQQLFAQSAKSGKAQSYDPSALMRQMQEQFAHMPQMAQIQNMMPNMPQFDGGAMQEKFASYAREASEQMQRASQATQNAAQESMEVARENAEAVVEVMNAAATVSKELMAELISYINRQFAQNTELSKQALTCRTLNDMFDLSTRILKSNLDSFFSESVKISEKLFQCATDCSEPLNERMTETTERMTKAMAS